MEEALLPREARHTPEVAELDAVDDAFLREEDLRRAHVAVDEAPLVHVLERGENANHDAARLELVQGDPQLLEVALQARARQPLRDLNEVAVRVVDRLLNAEGVVAKLGHLRHPTEPQRLPHVPELAAPPEDVPPYDRLGPDQRHLHHAPACLVADAHGVAKVLRPRRLVAPAARLGLEDKAVGSLAREAHDLEPLEHAPRQPRLLVGAAEAACEHGAVGGLQRQGEQTVCPPPLPNVRIVLDDLDRQVVCHLILLLELDLTRVLGVEVLRNPRAPLPRSSAVARVAHEDVKEPGDAVGAASPLR
mmetsp:Transcript_59719/g.153789  ORF Transcript_59719/g.153789 Transcript_59719/m.153789 type:complete len:305 (-) Transcript_59719:92-1006(-)